MNEANAAAQPGLSPWQTVTLSVCAVIAFHLAYSFASLSSLIVVYLFCLVGLSQLSTGRRAFYCGLTVGMLTFGQQLWFLWTIFGPAAFVLCLILAFWIGFFVALARLCGIRFGPRAAIVAIPIVWMGVEYFRSELYYLRFSWLNVGYAFSANCQSLAFSSLGVYGVGFVLMLLATGLWALPIRTAAICGTLSLVVFSLLANFRAAHLPLISEKPTARLKVAGIQMEFPVPAEVETALNRLIQQHSEAELLVLSEYTFDGPVPQRVKTWCQRHRRYLIVGGKDPISDSFYNTAFVIGPDGDVVFRQVKCVPIQFFKDGLPAPEQKVWHSPWGKLGICICYDLSYSRVVDQLVQLGAKAIIVPTMDVAEWGERQHRLHARIAQVRAAEYGLPIFRVCSSGISQLVDRAGDVIDSAPFPGEFATISGDLQLEGRGTVPVDRVIAPLSTLSTVLFIGWMLISEARKKLPGRVNTRGTKTQTAPVPL